MKFDKSRVTRLGFESKKFLFVIKWIFFFLFNFYYFGDAGGGKERTRNERAVKGWSRTGKEKKKRRQKN